MQRNGTSKRVAIYATYDSNGIIDDYIVYCLNALKTVVDDIVVVSNHDLMMNEKEKLTMVTTILEREDNAFDVGGYSCAINYLKSKGLIFDYDEMIIMNDSVFGPFYSFSEMFEKMDENSSLDFWGITSRGKSDFDGTDAVYPKHIQLYFYVIRKRMLHSEVFLKYWDYIVEEITDFRSAIIKYEFYFTKYFEDKGFLWDVYCKTPEYDGEYISSNLSPYHYCTYELISEKRCPLMKRKLFLGDFISGKYTNKTDAKKAVKFISGKTSYDTNMMWKHVLRVYPIVSIMHAMQMIEIISADDSGDQILDEVKQLKILDISPKKILFFYDDNFSYSKGKYTLVIRFDSELECPEILSNSLKRTVKENLLKNINYVYKMIDMFEKDELLGLMIPPMNLFGKIAYSLENRQVSEIKSKYVDRLDPLCVPSHKINGFICRNNLLSEPLLEEFRGERGLDLFRYMPYIAQKQGYYTKIIIESDWAASIVENSKSTILGLWNASQIELDNDCNLEEMQEKILYKRINMFADKHEQLYIYGAGGLAVKVVKLLKDRNKIESIIVSSTGGNEKHLLGIKVRKFDEIIGNHGGVIIAVGKKNSEMVKKRLLDNKFDDYIIVE